VLREIGFVLKNFFLVDSNLSPLWRLVASFVYEFIKKCLCDVWCFFSFIAFSVRRSGATSDPPSHLLARIINERGWKFFLGSVQSRIKRKQLI